MDRESIARQLQIEQGLITHVVASLRSILAWETQPSNASRKLSTLRFVAEMFHRHLERLMAIHEHDGYMHHITQMSAHLSSAVEVLKREHSVLREEVGRVVAQFERLSPENFKDVNAACERMRAVLETYDDHNEKEIELLQESLFRDIGGYG